MAEAAFPVAAAGSPTAYIDNETVTTTAGAVYRQRVRLGGGLGTLLAQVSGYGTQRVTPDNSSDFYDPFDTTIDTVNTWATPTGAGSGGWTQATGGITFTTGTTANSFATLASQPTFVGRVPGFEQIGFANQISAAPPAGTYAFFGVGTIPATPTPTAPLTDAIGFEIDTTGKLWAVVYQNGTRRTVSSGVGDGSLSSTGSNVQPTDGNYHRFSLVMRTDRTWWYVDSQDAHAAVSNFVFPSIQKLPIRFLVASGSSAPASAMTLVSTGAAAGDSGANSKQISDGVYPWRKAAVLATGAIQTGERRESTSNLPVIAAPAATGTVTAASGLASISAQGVADTTFPGGAPAAGSTVLLVPGSDHSSFSVQTTGTWVGTLATEVTMDGVTWVAVNTRQSGTGTLKNAFTVNGLYRGVLGGMYAMRVRATAWTSGTANIFLAVGAHAAVFQNSDVLAQSEAQYYASSAGANSGWSVSSQEVNFASTTEAPLLWLYNTDSTGGRVLYLSKTVVGSNGAIKIRRYRCGPGQATMTRTSGGNLLLIGNRANQSSPTGAAVAYAGTGLVMANQPTQYEKTTFVGANISGSSYGGQVETDESGSILIPPQTGILWTGTAFAAGTLAMVEVVWWDGSSLT